jgi:hypothetical protein
MGWFFWTSYWPSHEMKITSYLRIFKKKNGDSKMIIRWKIWENKGDNLCFCFSKFILIK